jgi:hypothetical protein
MKTSVIKRVYNAPEIETILLDNEISLTMTSTAPDDPEGGWGAHLENVTQSPFKENQA